MSGTLSVVCYKCGSLDVFEDETGWEYYCNDCSHLWDSTDPKHYDLLGSDRPEKGGHDG